MEKIFNGRITREESVSLNSPTKPLCNCLARDLSRLFESAVSRGCTAGSCRFIVTARTCRQHWWWHSCRRDNFNAESPTFICTFYTSKQNVHLRRVYRVVLIPVVNRGGDCTLGQMTESSRTIRVRSGVARTLTDELAFSKRYVWRHTSSVLSLVHCLTSVKVCSD